MSYLNRTNYKFQTKKVGFDKYKKPIFMLIGFALLFSFILWANIQNTSLRDKVYGYFNDIFHKAFTLTSQVGHTFSRMGGLIDYIALHEKYQKLEEENKQLKSTLNNLTYISQENIALRQLNKFVSGKGTLVASGNLVVKNPNAYSKEIRLLAGKKDGIKEGQIVLDKHSLLGRIINVGDNVSTVLLITDPVSKVPVIFPRVGTKGILSGTYDNSLEISILEKEILPNKHDVVVTSGDGGFFPPGLIVGNVKSIGENGEIGIQPLYDSKKLDFVSVIQY